MERWTSTEKGRHLKGRRSKNTEPELAVRRELHRRGFRFRLHRSLASGCNPDLVLPKFRLAVWDCVPASGVTPLRVMLCVVHYAVSAWVVSITSGWAGRVGRAVGSGGVSRAMEVSER